VKNQAQCITFPATSLTHTSVNGQSLTATRWSSQMVRVWTLDSSGNWRPARLDRMGNGGWRLGAWGWAGWLQCGDLVQ
jgi:hypothetical protein